MLLKYNLDSRIRPSSSVTVNFVGLPENITTIAGHIGVIAEYQHIGLAMPRKLQLVVNIDGKHKAPEIVIPIKPFSYNLKP
jgi:hypothetical protein